MVAVQFTSRSANVYNIEVEGLHNYRVGRNGVVVHNSDGLCVLLSSASAFIDPRMITEYLLTNSSKSSFSNNVLGSTASHADDLAKQLKNGLDTAAYNVLREGTKYGKKVNVPMIIVGPNGRQANIMTSWLLDPNASVWRFITAIPD